MPEIDSASIGILSPEVLREHCLLVRHFLSGEMIELQPTYGDISVGRDYSGEFQVPNLDHTENHWFRFRVWKVRIGNQPVFIDSQENRHDNWSFPYFLHSDLALLYKSLLDILSGELEEKVKPEQEFEINYKYAIKCAIVEMVIELLSKKP